MVYLQNWRGLLSCVMLVTAGLLAGCDGSSSDTSSAAATADNTAVSTVLNPGTTSSTSTQTGLTITGTPGVSVTAGQAYAFSPRAADSSGAVLQFHVAGKPSWASFDSSTGRLSGTPTSADVGVNIGVLITASNGTTTAALPPFEIVVSPSSSAATGTASSLTPPASSAPAAENPTTSNVTLAWIAPTQNTNGSALSNLGGYKIYYGTVSKQYTSTITVSNPSALSYVIDALTVGQQYFFAVTAVSAAGVESSNSPEISATIS